MTTVLTIGTILALVALVCGVLMLVSGRWSRFPLTAIAIIALALNQLGSSARQPPGTLARSSSMLARWSPGT